VSRKIEIINKVENSHNCVTVTSERVTIKLNGKDTQTNWEFLGEFLNRNIPEETKSVRAQFEYFTRSFNLRSKRKDLCFLVKKLTNLNAFCIKNIHGS